MCRCMSHTTGAVAIVVEALVGRSEVEAFAGKGALSAALKAKGFNGRGSPAPVDAAASVPPPVTSSLLAESIQTGTHAVMARP